MQLAGTRHRLANPLLERAVRVLVVGAGGTGSHVIGNLAVLHTAMVALGHPEGITVDVVDFDEVSHANVGRARFYPADVGKNKAAVLVQRINMCYGLKFRAIDSKVTGTSRLSNYDVIIGCVDTRESRRWIWQASQGLSAYWLDLGNGADDGQVVLGQTPGYGWGFTRVKNQPRLPCVVELYPEMMDTTKDPVDAGPSCGMAEALRRQSAFVNQAAALHGVGMLSTLFRDGGLDHHAVFFNVRSGRSSALACDPAAWARFGYAEGTESIAEEEDATDAA